MTAIEMIQRLVAFDTSNPTISNKPIIDDICHYLDNYAVSYDRIPSSDGRREGLLATIGPKDKPGMVLSGHLDTVPVDIASWDSPPFQAEIREGKLYGRGTCDMKGFIGCVLAFVPQLTQARLEKPIHIALTYDEETACRSITQLLDTMLSRIPLPLAAIVGESTEMRPIFSHRGVYDFKITVQGRAAHGSRPELGINAIVGACELIERLQKIERDYNERAALSPPVVFNIGKIEGGTAVNTVPESCQLTWEYRPSNLSLVGEIQSALLRQIKATMAQTKTTITMESLCVMPPLDQDPTHPFFGELFGDSIDRSLKFSGATEGGFYCQRGIPTVLCGPGDPQLAHRSNECIFVDRISQCQKFLERLIGIVRHL